MGDIAKEFIINNQDDMVECPYNPAHLIRAKRVQYHLLLCRQNHADMEQSTCPFNASHHVNKVELRYHMATCDDRHRIHGKILQERMDPSDQSYMGCIETPGYKPLNITGESWEDTLVMRSAEANEYVQRNTISPPPLRPEVRLSEEEVRGLNGREKRALYMKKKLDLERLCGAEREFKRLKEPQHQSQSMLVHQLQQQQQQQQKQKDIYEYLSNQHNVNQGLGRGRGIGLKVETMPVVENGQGRAAGKVRQPGLPINGVGAGGEPYNGGIQPGLITQMEQLRAGNRTQINPIGRGAPLSGRGNAAVAQNAFHAPGQNTVPVPMQGMGYGVGHSVPPSFSANSIGHGQPYYEPASQPSVAPNLYPSLFVGRGRGPGMPVPSEFPLHQQQTEAYQESSNDDDSEYQDAVTSWVGSGYDSPHGAQSEPSFSSSQSSLGSFSSHLVIGSWAEQVDREYPTLSASSSSSPISCSDNDDVSGASSVNNDKALRKKLKKVNQKLKRVQEIEKKLASGDSLDPDQLKLHAGKETLMAEKAKLEQQLNQF